MDCRCRVSLINNFKRDVDAYLKTMNKHLNDMKEEVEASKDTPDEINSEFLQTKLKEIKESRDSIIALGKSIEDEDVGSPPRCEFDRTLGDQYFQLTLDGIRSKILWLKDYFNNCRRSLMTDSWVLAKSLTGDLFAGHYWLDQAVVGRDRPTLFGPNYNDDDVDDNESEEDGTGNGGQGDETDDESEEDKVIFGSDSEC